MCDNVGFFSRGNILILAAILEAYSEGSTAQCTVKLADMVVREGTVNILELCNASVPVDWKYIPYSEEGILTRVITNDTDTVNFEYDNMFTVNNTGLTILNATTTSAPPKYPLPTAGIYIVVERTESSEGLHESRVLLTVVRQGPICGCIPINQTDFQMSCSITFAEIMDNNLPHPIFTWLSNGQVVFIDEPQPTRDIDFTVISISNFTANDTIRCQVAFVLYHDPTSTDDQIQEKAPGFNESCIAAVCPITTKSEETTDTRTTTTPAAAVTSSTVAQGTTPVLPIITTAPKHPEETTTESNVTPTAETKELTATTTSTSPIPSCKLRQIFIYTVVTYDNPAAANGPCKWVDPTKCPYDVRTCRNCIGNYELCSNSTKPCQEMCRLKTGNNNTVGHCADNFSESGCPCLFQGFKACLCS